jgi:hypothetical protein
MEPIDNAAMVAVSDRQYEILDVGLAMRYSMRGRLARIVARPSLLRAGRDGWIAIEVAAHIRYTGA